MGSCFGMARRYRFYFVFSNLSKFLGGQDTIFSLFGVLVWMIALLDNGDKEAGLGLALATLTPTVAGMLSIPFLFSRFRAGKWFILGTIVLGIYTIALVGVNGIIKFLALFKAFI